MTDYRFVMGLLVQGYAYRQIEATAGCSHRAIARARRVLDEEGFTTREQVDALTLEDIDRLFTDGRKSVVDEFVPVDIERVVTARLGRKKPPLKVLWARYLEADAPAGARFYGYERFCQIVAEHVRVNDLTLPIAHVAAHTTQVDWAGTQMQLTDPVTRQTTRVSVFVASLPFSGMVFAYGCLDEKQPAWLDAHRHAFEYFGGVTQVIVPDNASTASNQISRTEKTRDVNSSYADFLEYYGTAAVPTRSYRPRDKGNVEAGVKVVTNWVIHYLEGRVFASLDDLNAAVAVQVSVINDRSPFRGEQRSRRDWFTELEQGELISLPARRWEPVIWRKAKVHRDWHIQLDTIKYSVPSRFAGLSVDVRIIGEQIDVLCGGEIWAPRGSARDAIHEMLDAGLLDDLMGRIDDGSLQLTGEGGFIPEMIKAVLERGLGAELTSHLGYERGDPVGRLLPNSRNGTTPKTVHSEVGSVALDIPRDRDGSFEPRLVAKGERRIGGLADMIISLYAGGMTIRDIQAPSGAHDRHRVVARHDQQDHRCGAG